jgi:hypothetical protein
MGDLDEPFPWVDYGQGNVVLHQLSEAAKLQGAHGECLSKTARKPAGSEKTIQEKP